MAKKHLISYYKQIQEQYLEMLGDVQEFDDAYKSGHISQEQFDNAQAMMDRLKDNYDRLSYVLLLLNQPNKKDKKKTFLKQNKKLYTYFEEISQDKTIKDNEDVLKEFKKLIGKEKK